MKEIQKNDWRSLAKQRGRGPFLSFYQPVRWGSSAKEVMKNFEHLASEADRQLRELGQGFSVRERLIGNARRTIENVLLLVPHLKRNIALFSAPNFEGFAMAPALPQALVVVSKSFHIKPLIPMADESIRSQLDNEYIRAKSERLVTHTLAEILTQNRKGRVKKLIIARDENIWGDLEAVENNQRWILSQAKSQAGMDDLLDDLAERVAEKDAEVLTTFKRNLPGNKLALAFLSPDHRGMSSVAYVADPSISLQTRFSREMHRIAI